VRETGKSSGEASAVRARTCEWAKKQAERWKRPGHRWEGRVRGRFLGIIEVVIVILNLRQGQSAKRVALASAIPACYLNCRAPNGHVQGIGTVSSAARATSRAGVLATSARAPSLRRGCGRATGSVRVARLTTSPGDRPATSARLPARLIDFPDHPLPPSSMRPGAARPRGRVCSRPVRHLQKGMPRARTEATRRPRSDPIKQRAAVKPVTKNTIKHLADFSSVILSGIESGSKDTVTETVHGSSTLHQTARICPSSCLKF
jgi:hypothetical protein